VKSKRCYQWFLIAVTIGMLWLQLLDSFTLSDDLVYRFVFHENESEPLETVNSFSDLIRSQWCHYHTVNGRWFIHFLAQAFLCFMPPFVYQVISALLFTCMIHLGTTLAVDKHHRLFGAVLMCFFLFVVSSGFRTTMLWSMGTFNYLWVTTLTFAFFTFLKRLGQSKITTVHWFLSPLSVFIGCSHEALSLPVSITFIVYILMNGKRVIRQSIFLYMDWYIIGMLTVLVSPALWSRADDGITLMNRFMSGSINLFMNMRIGWILLLSLGWIFLKDRSLFRKIIQENRYTYLCFMLSLGIIIVCGTTIERVAFFTDFIALLLLLRMWTEMIPKKWHQGIVIVCSSVMLLFMIPAVMVRSENHNNHEYMKQQLMEPGKEVVSVRQPVRGESPMMDFFRDRYVYPSAEFGFYSCYMGFNANDINIRQAAKFYEKRQVVFLPKDVVQRIENDSNAYTNCEADRNSKLYVWKLKKPQIIHEIVFHLKPEDAFALWPHQRLLAYQGDMYVLDDGFRYSIVTLRGHQYLVFTCPTTNILRRLSAITLR